MDTPVDLTEPQRIHIVGIGGAGMSPIAEVLQAIGHSVSGSDQSESPTLERLRFLGVEVSVGHDAANLLTPDLVCRSTAIPDSNPEVVAARDLGVPVASRADVLAGITALRRTIAVAGTHGKTTTSSLLASVLEAGALDPSFIIGGRLAEFGTGARWSAGAWFAVEADESDGTFLRLDTELALITSVEPDHLEFYGGHDALIEAFARFASAAATCLLCSDDLGARALTEQIDGPTTVLTYGVEAPPSRSDGHFSISNIEADAAACSFTLSGAGSMLTHQPLSLRVPMPGVYNVRNAAAAVAVGLLCGAAPELIESGLSSFAGVGRRFERRGSLAGVEFVDDYAHLPTEVRAALSGAQQLESKRVVAVFQPHRFSRTEALWRTFEGAFDLADRLFVTPIYSSGEAPRPGVDGSLVAGAAAASMGSDRVVYISDRASVADVVAEALQPGDLCLTLGAGDSVALPDEIQALLTAEEGTNAHAQRSR